MFNSQNLIVGYRLKHPNSKRHLTEIIQMLNQGIEHKYIADKMKVSKSLISNIKNKRYFYLKEGDSY